MCNLHEGANTLHKALTARSIVHAEVDVRIIAMIRSHFTDALDPEFGIIEDAVELGQIRGPDPQHTVIGVVCVTIEAQTHHFENR